MQYKINMKKDINIVLTPKRKSWISFAKVELVDADFLAERPDMLEDGRVQLWKKPDTHDCA